MPKITKKSCVTKEKETIPSEVMEKIEQAIDTTFHGSVTLIVQDSRIIQIEKFERIRLC